MEALQPALRGELPLVFRADTHLDMHRVLNLVDEFGLKCLIDGAKSAHRIVEPLEKRKIPLIVRLDFPPEPKREEKAKKKEPEEQAAKEPTPLEAPEEPPSSTAPSESEPEKKAEEKKEEKKEGEVEPEKLFQDRKRRFEEAVKNVAVLHQHGLSFAFTTAGCESPKKFFENLRKAVAAGLPSQAALESLTRTPARFLGVDHELGTLEPGKLAHVVGFDGDFLDEKSEMRLAFVDGKKFEIKAKAEKKKKPKGEDQGGPEPTAEVAGTWSVHIESSFGNRDSTLVLEQTGTTLKGTMKSEMGTAEVKGSIEGNEIEFIVAIDMGGRKFDLEFKGTVEGNTMSGTIDTPFGESSKFKGEKEPSR
jgi:hypothetical protein